MGKFFQRSEKVPKRPLWALLWRMVLLGPVLGLVGLLMLFAGVAIWIGPVIAAISLWIAGEYLVAIPLLAFGIWWWPKGVKLMRWMLQGVEYA